MKFIRTLVPLALLMVLFSASHASAQTDPCAAVVVPNPTVTRPIAVGFCHDGKDVNGNPVQIDGFTVKVDTTVVFSGPLTPIGVANSAGMRYYETAKTITAGDAAPHTVTVLAYGPSGTSLPSTPLAFTYASVTPPPPPPPTPGLPRAPIVKVVK